MFLFYLNLYFISEIKTINDPLDDTTVEESPLRGEKFRLCMNNILQTHLCITHAASCGLRQHFGLRVQRSS